MHSLSLSRYVAWVHFDKIRRRPTNLNDALLDEELYDHRKETLGDYTHRETVNVARRPEFGENIAKLRDRLMDYLRNEVVFPSEKPTFAPTKQ